MNTKNAVLFYLALNSIAGYADNKNDILEKKYEKIYEKMTKNIQMGNSNDSSYKALEKVLNQRNSELKDLYLQSDFTIKPEFLEWQIFFNTFYNNSHRGGKKENVSNIVQGEAKNIDLGMVIPVREVTKNPVILSLSPVNEPVVDINIPEINVATPLPIAFTPVSITIPYIPTFFGPGYNLPTGRNSLTVSQPTNIAAYNTTGTKIYENLNVDSPNGTTITWDGSTSSTLTMTGVTNYVNGGVSGSTPANETHTGQNSTLLINNIGLTGDYNISGNWTVNINSTFYNNLKFLSYQPFYITSDSSVSYDGTLILNDLTTGNQSTSLTGMALNLANSTATGQPKARLENKGNIVLYMNDSVYYPRTIGMQLESLFSASAIKGELVNSGKITIDTAPGANPYSSHLATAILINNGTFSPTADVKIGNIDLKSSSGYGLEIASGSALLTDVNIDGAGGIINITGTYSTGTIISSPVASASANSQIENIKNLNIKLDSQYSTAILLNLPGTTRNSVIDSNFIESFTLGDNASASTVIANYGGNVIVDSSFADVLDYNKGIGNVVLLNADGNMKNYATITIGSGSKSGVALYNGFTNNTTTLENYGDVVINSTNDPSIFNSSSIGMAISNGLIQNYANVTINSDKSAALYGTRGTLTSNTGNITVNGNNSIGIFSSINGTTDPDKAVINLASGNIELNGQNGALFFIYGGFIGLGSAGNTVNATVNGKDSYLFYNTKDYYNNSGKYTINGDVNAEVKNEAIAFSYAGSSITDPPVDLSSYLADSFNVNNGTLNVDISDDSYLFTVTNTGINLSSLNNVQLSGMNLTGSKKAKMRSVSLNIDVDSNLDKLNNTGNKSYRDIELVYSNISINNGITVSGTEDNQAGISQAGTYIQLNLTNNGTIDLSGQDTVGIYGEGSILTNNGVINLKDSLNGTGLYSNQYSYIYSTVTNNSDINIGQSGIGIYGSTGDYSSSTINSNGTIKGTGSHATGIYIENNGASSTANLVLSSASNIDLKDSENGIGLYTDNTDISGTNAGTITVGENGVGIYAKNGTSTLNNLTLNLFGDNSLGIYTDGTNSFTGNGTVNVDGKNAVIFNILGTGSFSQNFNITSTSGSSYIFGNIKNTSIYSNSSVNLSENGIYINGVNSAVLLGENSNLTSNDSNIIGMVLSGGYIGGLPVVINGKTLNYEATNQGNISFGDNSTGIYVINGASGENQGTISLGQNSVGIYGNGAGSSVSNTGTISTGQNSVGMYLEDGDNLINTGNITGSSARTVGLYLENDSASEVSNNGTINLSGDRSIGIYASGGGAHTINNTNTILIGDSITETDPSIGIYSKDNSTVNNSGNITSGKTSIGIYNNSGRVNHTLGTINAGETGVGLYTDSGSLNLSSGTLKLNGIDSIGIYATNSAVIDNNMLTDVSSRGFGVVLNSGSSLINRNTSEIGNHGVFLYSDNADFVKNESGADVTMLGSDSIGFYMINGGNITNKASITADTGDSNIGIYNKGGSIDNSGDIKIGGSIITDPSNPFANSYAVGLYGEDIQSMKNTGNIEIGADAVGFYSKNGISEAVNEGNITSNSNKSIGIYLEKSNVRNTGNITLSGDSSIGIAAARNSSVKNAGIITMNGDNSIGIYANAKSKIVNESTGKIYINGNQSTGVQLSEGSTLENYGLIEVASGTTGSVQVVEGDPVFTPPSIVNAGIIKVDEKFDLSGLNIVIKSDPASFRAPTIEEITAGGYAPEDINAGFLLTNTVKITAPSFNFGSRPVGIDPNFTQGTNARVYKFENVFDPTTPGGGPNTGEISIKSGSLTFDAIPVTNDNGKIDIWMEKIDYDNFTQGAWYDSFAKNIEENYLNAEGEALKLYDKLDLITDVDSFRNNLGQLAGNMYANITQREQNINEVLNNTLLLLQNSENNTKENVKINIIAGKGSAKEDTNGIEAYDYQTTGILALREVERTYRHKFGYSLGYTRTDFQMKDTNDEDQADTMQLGLHNKYSVNGWNIKNDLLGIVSFHDVNRSIDWSGGTKSDLKSNYNVYGVSLLNEAGRDFEISRNAKVTPYAGLELGYMMHPDFEEKNGAESLKVDSNNAYSIKPNIGVRLEGTKEFGAASSWKLKGNIGVGYEYELGNMNNPEKASLSAIENGYHELAKAEEDKGKIKTSGYVGVELKETYGIYVTGEYGAGRHNQEDYKIGLSLKAIF